MSGYTVEEENECPIFVNTETNTETIEYWKLYSNIQKKRFSKCLYQLKDIWFSVYKTLKFVRDYNNIETCNELMLKVHKLFILEHNNKIEFYNEEKMRLRKQKNYLSKKINKLKNAKNKI